MNVDQIEKAVKEVIGKDPMEMVINYYKGLIQYSADRIAEEQKTIRKLQNRIKELDPKQNILPTKKESNDG